MNAPSSHRSFAVPAVGIVLLGIIGVAAFVPMFRCRTHYCYQGYQETLRCLHVARTQGYPQNVVDRYEEQARTWTCGSCVSWGRATLLQHFDWRLPWQLLPSQR
jgi:hypothetical protein